MGIATVVTGDDTAFLVQLTKRGAAFAIASGAAVKAAVVSIDRAAVLVPAVACLNNAPEADWTASLVAIQFTSAATAPVTQYGPAWLEIEVDDGGKLTWMVQVAVIKGNI